MLAGRKLVLAAGCASQALRVGCPEQDFRFANCNRTCTGDALDVVSLWLDYASGNRLRDES